MPAGGIVVLGGAGRPPNIWRVWAAFYDENTGRYSNPCNPFYFWSHLPTIVGAGSPFPFLQYGGVTGSSDPAVSHVHFFRSSRNSEGGFLVSEAVNTPGVLVTSGHDIYSDEELQALPPMETDNDVAPIAR